MTPTPYIAIVNGAAGGGRCGRRARAAIDALRKAGMEVELRDTEGPTHATELARAAYTEGHRNFLAVGGDGTTFEVINGLFPRAAEDRDPITLGILPLGTGNSFLRDFGILDERAAMTALERGNRRRVDVVRATHSEGELHFINLLSIGFSARAGALMNDRFKPFGAAGYVLAVLTSVVRLEHPVFSFRLDDQAIDDRPAALLSFSNSRFTGGAMMMAPHADVSDGELDVIRVGPLGRARFVSAFPRIFRGTHVAMTDVEERRAKKVAFAAQDKQSVMVDGEILSLALRSLEVVPQALEVIA